MNKTKRKLTFKVFAALCTLAVATGIAGGAFTASADEHMHSFSQQWSVGTANHWHACECGTVRDMAAHKFENGKCIVCDTPQADPLHVHTFDETEWVYDSVNHWHASDSDCGHNIVKDIAPHTGSPCICGYKKDGDEKPVKPGNEKPGFPDDNKPVELPQGVSAGGYFESLYAEFPSTSVNGVTAAYKLDGEAQWTAIDKELIRVVNGNARIDAVGLKAGTYELKISSEGKEITVPGITVSAYDRSGYAHFNRQQTEVSYGGVGAYKDDGTLKDNALVIYVTESNKNNVSNFVYKNTANGLVKEDISQYIKPGKPQANGKDLGGETYASIGYILNNRGYANNNEREAYGIQKLTNVYGGVAVRIIGKVESALNSDECSPTLTGLTYYAKAGNVNPITGETYKKGVAVPNGGTVNDNGQMARITNAKNVTVEGIGEDAMIYGWGIHYVSNDNLHKNKGAGTSFEVRNITFESYPEDALGMEGTQGDKVDNTGSITSGASSATADLISPVERCWIHNNTFLPGHCAKPAESDKAEGDGSCDFKRGQYYTLAYNYFEYCHKTNLIGSSDTTLTFNVTMHHNWWYNCGSRQPLARRANIHFYNNYIYGNPADSKAELSYVTSLRGNCLVFSEANYYDGCKNVTQKKDGTGVAFDNIYYSCSDENNFTELTSRTQTVSNNCKFTYRNIDYSQFYVDSSKFYYDSENKQSDCLLDSAVVARVRVMMFAGVNGWGKSRAETTMNEVTPQSAVSVGEGGVTVDLTKVPKGGGTVSDVVFSNISGVSSGEVKGKGQMITFTLSAEAQLTITTKTSGDLAPSLVRADGLVIASKFTGTQNIVLQEGTYFIATGIKDKESVISELKFSDTSASSAARVEAAVEAINSLPAQITVGDGEAVRAAAQAYNALTASEKKDFDTNLVAKLEAAEAAYETALINDVIAKIDAIEEPVTKDSYAEIQTAQTAFDALTASQQAKVTNAKKLTDAQQAFSVFAVQNVIDMIEALPDVATLDFTDKGAVDGAQVKYNATKAAFDLLDDGVSDDEETEEINQQAQVTNASKLTSGLTQLAQFLKLFEFKDMLEGLDVQTVTLAQGRALTTLYNQLDTAQKNSLTGDQKQKYEDIFDECDKLAKQSVANTFVGGKASSTVFKVNSGSAANSSLAVSAYGETPLASGLKMESGTQVEFTISTKMTLKLYLNKSGNIKVGTTKTTNKEGNKNEPTYSSVSENGDNVVTVTLEAGTYYITKDSSVNLYYATLVPAN